MSKSIGNYLANKISVLREWRNTASRVAQIIKQLVPEADVYVFGSTVTGRITGASDIDLLVVVPDDLSEREVHTYLSIKLEEYLGSSSYIVDLHIVRRESLDKPPYSWWLKNSVKVD